MRKITGHSILVISGAAFCFLIFLSFKSYGIPAFARKYRTSCSTCHESITKRNEFGEAFRRVGYYMPIDNAQKVKEKPVSLGADEWKELWPEAIWPGSLPPSFPLAIYTQFRINKEMHKDSVGHSFEFNMPRDLVFLFGGAFGEDVAFFGEWAAYMEGQNAVGLFRFFFQFNNVIGNKSLLNIRVGRFEPGITDGLTGSQKLTLSFANTLGYDPGGGWKPQNPQTGIELNGIYKNKLYYSLGVVNGEAKTVKDPTDHKDVYGRLAYQFGGTGFDGRDSLYKFGDESTAEQFANIGIYSYFGSRNNIASKTGLYDNYFSRYGFDFMFHYNKFDFFGGIIVGKDDNPFNDNYYLRSSAAFVECNYKLYPWFTGALRFEKSAAWNLNDDKDNYYSIIPNLTILYRANIRFSIEGLFKINGDKKLKGTNVEVDNSNVFQSLSLNSLIAF